MLAVSCLKPVCWIVDATVVHVTVIAGRNECCRFTEADDDIH